MVRFETERIYRLEMGDKKQRQEMDLVGIELGGTKCICTLGNEKGEILASLRVPTSNNPDQTLHAISIGLEDLITQHNRSSAPFKPAALGIAAFGPLDLTVSSPTYGSVTATPKPGWSGKNILHPLKERLHLPTAINTDVNAAALAEGRWGAAQGLDNFVYVTIGTGIGAGIVSQGRLLHGLTHPEIGHMRIPNSHKLESVSPLGKGACPFHGDCLEGLASGSAIETRSGMSAKAIPFEHPIWNSAALALAHMCHNLTLMFAPQRILLGGGVIMGHSDLVKRIRTEFLLSLNDYASIPKLIGDPERYIQLAGLGDQAGPLGSLALAQSAAQA